MNMNDKIRLLLLSLGIKPHVRGFKYLIEAIQIYAEANGDISITKELYPQIAFKFDTTGSRVERAMRHAIGSIGYSVPMHTACKILDATPNIDTGTFKNREFIALCAMKIGGAE